MNHIIRRILSALLILGASPSLAMAETERFEARRPDGSTVHWYLDRPSGVKRTGLIVLAQGSGCLSVVHSRNLALTRSLFPGFTALTVEKYGVAPGDNSQDDHRECSAAFRKGHTVTQRVSDYRRIIEGLRGASWWNGQLVLFGGSEGGLAMAILAEQVKADAAILVSTAGGIPFGQIVRQSIPKEGWPIVDAEFAKARQNPESSQIWAGSSYRFWADIIDRRVADDMLRADTAFLLVQGGNDPSSPIGAARATSDLFAAAGRCNLTYWEFPSYNHGMADADGKERMSEVLSRSVAWLKDQLSSSKAETCMRSH